ncbi:hypothetical protein ACM66B_004423 [Microbotryomycetes sp. NB124-2]
MKRQRTSLGRDGGGVVEPHSLTAGPSRLRMKDGPALSSYDSHRFKKRPKRRQSLSPGRQAAAPARSAILSLEGSLSEEILLRCLSYLEIDDLMQVSRVSSAWHRLSQDPHLWKALYMSTFGRARAERHLPQPSSSVRVVNRPWRELYKISVNWRRGVARSSTITKAVRQSVLAPAPGDLAVEGEQPPVPPPVSPSRHRSRPVAGQRRSRARPTDTILQFHGQLFFTASRSQTSNAPTVVVHRAVPSGGDSVFVDNISSPALAEFLATGTDRQSTAMSITEMRLDEVERSFDLHRRNQPLLLAVFYSTGQYSLFSIETDPDTSMLAWQEVYCSLSVSPLSRLTLAFDPVVLARVHSPLIVTCSSSFIIRFLRVRRVHDDDDKKLTRTVVEEIGPTMQSNETWEPVSLTVKETTTLRENVDVGVLARVAMSIPDGGQDRSFKVTLAYSTPVYPDGWTVGLQEFIWTIPQDPRRRCLFDSFHATAPLSDQPRFGGEFGHARSSDLVTAIEHSDPFVVTSRADNTIQVYETVHHRCQPLQRDRDDLFTSRRFEVGSSRAFELIHRRTLFGHTSGVTSVAVESETGTCVSMAKDGQVKVWQLRCGQDEREDQPRGRRENAPVDVVDSRGQEQEQEESDRVEVEQVRKPSIWDEMKALRRRNKSHRKTTSRSSERDDAQEANDSQEVARKVWFDRDKIVSIVSDEHSRHEEVRVLRFD